MIVPHFKLWLFAYLANLAMNSGIYKEGIHPVFKKGYYQSSKWQNLTNFIILFYLQSQYKSTCRIICKQRFSQDDQ